MNSNSEEVSGAAIETDERLWLALFNRQYDMSIEGRKRRRYMDLAEPPFYPKIIEMAGIRPYDTVLDEGCGDGKDIVLIKKAGHRGLIVGVELPVADDRELTENKIFYIEEMIKSEDVNLDHVELMIGYAEELEIPDESFDIIWVANTLQHCYDIDKVLNNIYRMLKPGGKLVIVTNHVGNKPRHHGLLNEMAAEINGVAPPPYSSRFNSETGPKIMGRHRHHFKQSREIIQERDDNLRLTEEELPYLLASLSTYWTDIKPPNPDSITREELIKFLGDQHNKRKEVLDKIEGKLLEEIHTSPDGAIYDTIKRVAYVYEKRSNKASVFILNSLVQISNSIIQRAHKLKKEN